ncbi:MAG: hypothetical protein E6H07_15865 [Bacteroidetes bacterium]|nr:MAG: hypothetical protein E6H07_15865 [Bacteroidota bacterium]
MFRQTWKIYLPVINILIKKSATGEQSLSMNHTDFERAAGGRKIKFSFSAIEINNGRIPISSKLMPLASDLVMLLQEDDQSKKLLANRKFEFAMSNDFMLAIRDITVAVETN